MRRKKTKINNLALMMIDSYNDIYPGIWETIDTAVSKHGYSVSVIRDTVEKHISKFTYEFIDDMNKDSFVECAPTFYMWRKNKQCFKFAAELQDSLMNQNDSMMEVPIDIFERLPYSCFYIDVNTDEEVVVEQDPLGMTWFVRGFYVYIFKKNEEIILQTAFIMENIQEGLEIKTERRKNRLLRGYTFSVQLGESVANVLERTKNMSEALLKDKPDASKMNKEEFENFMNNDNGLSLLLTSLSKETNRAVFNFFPGLIQMLLYLCAENAEIVENEQQKIIYRQPGPTAFIKDRLREVRQWDVGVKTSEILYREWKKKTNKSFEDQEIETDKARTEVHKGTHVATHMRKAHWHHFWTGSHSEPTTRKLILRWVNPVMVNANLSNELPVTHTMIG